MKRSRFNQLCFDSGVPAQYRKDRRVGARYGIRIAFEDSVDSQDSYPHPETSAANNPAERFSNRFTSPLKVTTPG